MLDLAHALESVFEEVTYKDFTGMFFPMVLLSKKGFMRMESTMVLLCRLQRVVSIQGE